jgi:hypothetical protein
MADTTFISKVTVIANAWLQAVNDWLYKRIDPNYAVTTGTSTAYVLTLPVGSLLSSLAEGAQFIFRAHTSNGAAATLSIVGAATIGPFPLQSNGEALRYGSLSTNSAVTVVYYNSTFQVVSLPVIYDGFPVIRWLPAGYVTDGSVDYTTQMQAAIDAVEAAGGGILTFPPGTFKGNCTIKGKVIIRGAGMHSTKFIPATNDAVFKTPLTTITQFIGWEDCWIYGDSALANQDGILLKATTAATYINLVTLRRVCIQNSGRDGLSCYGTSTAGPFVQQLLIDQCLFADNVRYEKYIDGYIFEVVSIDTFYTRGIAGPSGNYETIKAVFNSGSIRRLLYLGGGINNLKNANLGNATAAVYAEHAHQLTFLGVDLESALYFIYITGNLTRNLTVTGCSFGTTFAVTAGILVEDCDGLTIRNNNFAVNGAVTVTDWISTGTAATNRVTNVDIGDNNYSFAGGATLSGKITNIATNVTIASGYIRRYRDQLMVETEAAAATDDLDYIYDYDDTGTTQKFEEGALITITPINQDHTVVVKHGTGNLYTVDGNDVPLLHVYESITFKWNSYTSKWVELTRSVGPEADSVASAASITISCPAPVTYCAISGTATIDTITAVAVGKMLVLKFNSTAALSDGVGNLRLSAAFTGSADDTVTLVCDGTNWLECARSVN